MYRTYKSKKDTGGGLDPRDMLINIDNKSSAFDAFYIQNIKQTKRELSCIGASNHYGASVNRVRKRRPPKRVVKNVEVVPTPTASETAFLTPDKSFRVNKAPDPFDQLLNSPSVRPAPKQFKMGDSFDKLLAATPKETKTYTRKKTAIKKFNYMTSDSSSSESDKENSTQNVTDIGSHNLIIERESKPNPTIDESINNIVKKLSMIRHYSSFNKSITKTFKNNRLTNNFKSPTHKTSPLCSTPFVLKSRTKSIYKFSPIAMRDLEDSPEYLAVVEDENDTNKSIVFNVPKTSHTLKKSTTEETTSPDSHLSNCSRNNSSKNKTKSKSLFSSVEDSHESISKQNPTATDIENEKIVTTQDNSLQISEVEPFLGFSNETIAKVADRLQDNAEIDKSIILPIENSKHSKKSRELSKIMNATEASNYFSPESDKAEKNTPRVDSLFPESPDIAETNENTSGFNVSYETSIPSKPFLGFSVVDDDQKEQDLNDSDNSQPEDNESNSSFDSQDNGESLYNTCYSEDVQDVRDEEKAEREPVVSIERMSRSLFEKYYNRKINSSSGESSSLCTESNSEDTNSEISEGTCIDKSEGELDSDDTLSSKSNTTNDFTIYEDEDDSSSRDTDSSENNETTVHESRRSDENKCVSFVTTRRRNGYANDSSIIVLDDSQESLEDDNKTVISVKENILDVKNEVVNVNNIKQESSQFDETMTYEEKSVKIDSNPEDVALDISRSFIDSNNLKENKCEGTHIEYDDTVPGIVLQPGKKWERSLSIYRRMTTMHDHFDQSILEDENLKNKGRKYRESVINTMELQDRRGSLHNESINSRRSTFVSKPSKSTIRIVKVADNSRISLSTTTVYEDLKGFLEDCDDTIVELSKLSISEDHDVTVLEKFHDSSRIAAKEYVLRRCNQSDTLLFDECYPDTELKNCRKIGEGVFGEVFLWRAPDGLARVMKIVPIAGHVKVNGEQQKDFHEIIAEIVIAMELSALRAPIADIESQLDKGESIDSLDLHSVENATDVFNEVLAVRCVYGSYPSRLLDLWELYDECSGSENDNPAILPPDQQFIVLELANAGQDLESYQFTSADQAHSLFLQVAFGLAVGEEAFQFEHRDLHWGNVLIQPTDKKYATFVVRGRLHRVITRSIIGTIIDYSLSRLSLPLPTSEGGTRPGLPAAALYNDLAADEGLFEAVGDYQFQVYRLMRDKICNDWKTFEPYTNILWLHYILDKMITALRYKKTNTKIHKQYIAKLKGIKERILNYSSAADFVLTDNEY